MTTMTAVSAIAGVSADQLDHAKNSRIFSEWTASLDPRFAVQSIIVQAVDYRRDKPSVETVKFVRLCVRAANTPFDQIVELRGGTVVMLPILRCAGVEYTVIVRQPRLATGCWDLPESPAGMIDGGTFIGAAAKEIEQELGLRFEESELEDLTDGEGIYLSCGLLDEQAEFYLAERDVPPTELARLQGKATGVAEEGEHIVLEVIPLSELPQRTRDGKAFIALALYREHKAR